MTTPTGILFSDPQAKPLSTAGQFQAGAYYLFYLTGTTTPANVYADGLLTTPLSQTPGASQPSCTADSAGRFNQIYLNPATTYRVQLYNSVGSKLEDTDPYVVPQPITQATVSAALWPQTQSEINASIVPTSTLYPPGDLRRYGADPTGIAASDTALSNACLCNSDVFDGYPGGGTYLFNTGVTLTTYPLTVRGQAKNNKDAATNVGTVFTLAAAAGNAAGVLNAAYMDGLNVRGIGFQFAAAAGALSQYGIHIKTISATAGQLRSSIIENCAFLGNGAGDTNIGIQIDTGTGGSQYSAFNTIRSNYFAHINAGINFTGNTTPNDVISNTFLGYTGAASAAAGSGVYIASPGAEVKIIGNYFEGWTQGVYANGSTNTQQVANDYQACTYSYNWVASAGSLINNQSFAETGNAGTYSGQANLDGSQMQTAGRLGWLATGGAIQSTRGFQEGNGSGSNLRAALLGYFTSPVFSAGNFAATGGGSWTVTSGEVVTYDYNLIGGQITVRFVVAASTCASTPTSLTIAIPASLTAIGESVAPCLVENNGTFAFGFAQVNNGATVINIYPNAAASGWTNGAGNTGVYGSITFRVIA